MLHAGIGVGQEPAPASKKVLYTVCTQAAAKVLRFLARADFGANPVADVRDA